MTKPKNKHFLIILLAFSSLCFLMLSLPKIEQAHASLEYPSTQFYFDEGYDFELTDSGSANVVLDYTFRLYCDKHVETAEYYITIIVEGIQNGSNGGLCILKGQGNSTVTISLVSGKNINGYNTGYTWQFDDDLQMHYIDITVYVAKNYVSMNLSAAVVKNATSGTSLVSPEMKGPSVSWIDDFSGIADGIVNESKELKSKVESLETEIEGLNAEIAELNAEIEVLNAEIAELEQEILDLKATHSDELDAKQVEYDLLMAQKLQLDADLNKAKADLATVESTLDLTQTGYLEVIRDWEGQVRDLKKENSDLKDENEELKKQIEKTQTLGCSASMGVTLPVAFTVLLSGLVIMGRVVYARKKEKI